MSKAPRLHKSAPVAELLPDRRRVELGDFRKTFFLRGVRARDEGAADLGAVPAGHHAETLRLFGLDMTRGENLHGGSFDGRCAHAAGTSCDGTRSAPFKAQ